LTRKRTNGKTRRVIMKERILSDSHIIFEDFVERMPVKQWRQILLSEMDTFIMRGNVRKLKARSLGAGVVSVYKEPLKGADNAKN